MGCTNCDGLGQDQWPQGVHQVREGGDGLEAAFVSSERQQRVGEGASAGCTAVNQWAPIHAVPPLRFLH